MHSRTDAVVLKDRVITCLCIELKNSSGNEKIWRAAALHVYNSLKVISFSFQSVKSRAYNDPLPFSLVISHLRLTNW